MYRFIKGGLTLLGRVWLKGEVLSDKQAKEIGLEKWFRKTKGKTWNGRFVEYIEGEPPEVKTKAEVKKPKKENVVKTKTIKAEPAGEVTIKTETITPLGKTEDGLIQKIKGKGFTLAKAKDLSWKELCKLFGPVLAKKIKDYDKSKHN